MASGEEISKYGLQEWGETLRFGEPFTLNLTDYNIDGTYELLIGQRISDNENSCYMYYITEELQIGCYDNIGEWVQHTIDLELLNQTEK